MPEPGRGHPADRTVGLSLEDASGALLAQVEDLEAARARLDGRIVDAYGALRTMIGEQIQEHEHALAAARAAKGLPAPMTWTTPRPRSHRQTIRLGPAPAVLTQTRITTEGAACQIFELRCSCQSDCATLIPSIRQPSAPRMRVKSSSSPSAAGWVRLPPERSTTT